MKDRTLSMTQFLRKYYPVASQRQCENCIFRLDEWRDGGWCYFWRDPVKENTCHLFEVRPAEETGERGV